MSRKSAAALAVQPGPSNRNRPPPPADLPTEAAALWVEICGSVAADYFTTGDLLLLHALVLATSQKAACDALVASEGLIQDGKPHPAIKLSIQLASSMAALSSKLRLCKSSRVRAESADLRKSLNGAPRPWEVADETAEFFQ